MMKSFKVVDYKRLGLKKNQSLLEDFEKIGEVEDEKDGAKKE